MTDEINKILAEADCKAGNTYPTNYLLALILIELRILNKTKNPK